MRPTVFALFILCAIGCALSVAGPADDACRLTESWAAGFNANDPVALTKLYSPDTTALGLVSPSLVEGTDQIRTYFSNLPGSGFKVSLGEMRAVTVGENLALCTGFYDFVLVKDGRQVPVQTRFSMLLARRDDGWLILHHHASTRPTGR